MAPLPTSLQVRVRPMQALLLPSNPLLRRKVSQKSDREQNGEHRLRDELKPLHAHEKGDVEAPVRDRVEDVQGDFGPLWARPWDGADLAEAGPPQAGKGVHRCHGECEGDRCEGKCVLEVDDAQSER